jgi:hypothetical protein
MTLIYTMNALFERRYLEFRSPPRGDEQPLPMRMAFEYVTVNFFRGLATQKGVGIIDEMVKKIREKRKQI